ALEGQGELHLVLQADPARVHLGPQPDVLREDGGGRGDDEQPGQEAPHHQSLPFFGLAFGARRSFFCCAFSSCWSVSRSCMARSFGIPVSFWKRSCSFSCSVLGLGLCGPWPGFLSCSCFFWSWFWLWPWSFWSWSFFCWSGLSCCCLSLSFCSCCCWAS